MNMVLRGVAAARLAGLLAACWALVGCMSPETMRKYPGGSYTSPKAAKLVAMCVADRWENTGIGGGPQVLFRPTETGYTLSVRNEMLGSLLLMLDVVDLAGGSRSDYFKGVAIMAGPFEKAVVDCQ